MIILNCYIIYANCDTDLSDCFRPVLSIQIVNLIHLAKNLACGGNFIVQ